MLTAARASANAAYRFAPPFLALIASDLGVRLSTLGVALGVSELVGLAGPAIGRRVDRMSRAAAMVIGLVGVAIGCVVLALAPGVLVLAAGLVVVSLTKIVFDVSLAAWVADRVPLARRGRVIGLTETSWALGLLVGVPLMGLATAVAGWRWAYALPAIAAVVSAGAVRRRVGAPGAGSPSPHPPVVPASGGTVVPLAHGRSPSVRVVVACFFLLMSAQQCIGVVYGAWLEDEAGLGGAGLAAVTFVLGAAELVASSTTVRVVDRWGARRAVRRGALLMAPSALALGVLADPAGAGAGVVLLVTFVLGFEFAIVSLLSLAGELRPGNRAAGIGLAIAAGTLGRALLAFPATVLYEARGIGAPAVLSAAFVTGLVVLLGRPDRARMAA